MLPFSLMMLSPIENATPTPIDVEVLSTILTQTKAFLDIRCPIAVRLVDEVEMIHLNTQFRNVPESTDVLTFPSGLDSPLPLGDIAICIPYAAQQAALRRVPLLNELIALLVHGCLHLVGYDDIEDADREAMQATMNEIGNKLKIPIDAEWTSLLHRDEGH